MKNLLLVTLLLSCVSLVYCQKKITSPPPSDSVRSPYDKQPVPKTPNILDKQLGAKNDKLAAEKIAFYECAHPDNAPYIFGKAGCLEKYSQSIAFTDCETTAYSGHHTLLNCFNEFKDRISQAECESFKSRLPDARKKVFSACNNTLKSPASSDAPEDKQNIDQPLDNIPSKYQN